MYCYLSNEGVKGCARCRAKMFFIVKPHNSRLNDDGSNGYNTICCLCGDIQYNYIGIPRPNTHFVSEKIAKFILEILYDCR